MGRSRTTRLLPIFGKGLKLNKVILKVGATVIAFILLVSYGLLSAVPHLASSKQDFAVPGAIILAFLILVVLFNLVILLINILKKAAKDRASPVVEVKLENGDAHVK